MCIGQIGFVIMIVSIMQMWQTSSNNWHMKKTFGSPFGFTTEKNLFGYNLFIFYKNKDLQICKLKYDYFDYIHDANTNGNQIVNENSIKHYMSNGDSCISNHTYNNNNTSFYFFLFCFLISLFCCCNPPVDNDKTNYQSIRTPRQPNNINNSSNQNTNDHEHNRDIESQF